MKPPTILQGIDAAIVRAWRRVQRDAALSGDTRRVDAVRTVAAMRSPATAELPQLSATAEKRTNGTGGAQ
ncbi:MAG: hypothetical protein JNK64_20890 [Myxococcales bacterium]|nr:hypothetical protein [Myxococcales bacterium]